MTESDLSCRVTHSRGRQLFDMASKFENVINLTLGDPDMLPELTIRNAGCEAIMKGNTRYSANAGLYGVRKAYVDFINERYNTNFLPENNVIVTVGAMEALYLALLSSINPGDDVIIFSPYYINYYQMIRMCGGNPVIVETKEENDFIPQLEIIREAICNRTKMIIINSPHNPTGTVYPSDTINGIIEIAQENRLLLISDEVYSALVYRGNEHYSVLQNKNGYKDVLVVDSCSKRFSMTGWRIGFATGPEEWIEAMTKLQENVAACAPLPSQYAALEAYERKSDITEYMAILEKRRDVLVRKLAKTDKLFFTIPKAAFYLFVNVKKTGKSGMEFSLELLEKEKVAVVPGDAYGDSFGNYIRIAYTIEERELLVASKRILDFCGEHT